VTQPASPGLLLASDRAASPRTLMDILRETADANPQSSALADADGALSYRELLRAVDASAARLVAAGVRRGDRVGIRIPSGTRTLYISILATLAAGASYVPVDADDPEERAELVFGEAGVIGIIGADGTLAGSTATANGTATGAVTVLDAPEPEDDAWVIFTSGSTGVPKGVAVTHRSAAAFVDAEARLFLQQEPIGPGDNVLAGLSVAFDASCEEMWLA
jgi:non-ribosomal peptide synthetase component F